MKKLTAILLIILSAFFLSCGKKTSDGIIINMGAEPRTIDPSLNTLNVVSAMLFHAFESLTTIGPDGKLTAGMAESWDISEDGKIYTFHLRTNALWSDGKPVTAHDFEYGWKFKSRVSPGFSFSRYREKEVSQMCDVLDRIEEKGIEIGALKRSLEIYEDLIHDGIVPENAQKIAKLSDEELEEAYTKKII